jgi:thiol-disulfide isomerase/thioredoxin
MDTVHAEPIELPRVNDENFEEYHTASAAAVFYKIANCHNCDEYEPVIQAAVRQFSPKVKFGRGLMHIPGSREIKKRYEFESFPTTHLYKRGKLVFSASEQLEAEALVNAIREHLIG